MEIPVELLNRVFQTHALPPELRKVVLSHNHTRGNVPVVGCPWEPS